MLLAATDRGQERQHEKETSLVTVEVARLVSAVVYCVSQTSFGRRVSDSPLSALPGGCGLALLSGLVNVDIDLSRNVDVGPALTLGRLLLLRHVDIRIVRRRRWSDEPTRSPKDEEQGDRSYEYHKDDTKQHAGGGPVIGALYYRVIVHCRLSFLVRQTPNNLNIAGQNLHEG